MVKYKSGYERKGQGSTLRLATWTEANKASRSTSERVSLASPSNISCLARQSFVPQSFRLFLDINICLRRILSSRRMIYYRIVEFVLYNQAVS